MSDILERLQDVTVPPPTRAEAAAEIKRLRAHIATLAEAGTGYSQQTVDAITAEREALRKEWRESLCEAARLRDENNILRTLAANGNADCVYCGLPAADMAKCAHGFPGCARADDMMALDNVMTGPPEVKP